MFNSQKNNNIMYVSTSCHVTFVIEISGWLGQGYVVNQ